MKKVYKVEVRDWYEDEEPKDVYEVDGYVDDKPFYDNHFYIDNDRLDGRADIVKCVDSEKLIWETVEDGVWVRWEEDGLEK